MPGEIEFSEPLEAAMKHEIVAFKLNLIIENIKQDIHRAKTLINDPTYNTEEQDALGEFILNSEAAIQKHSTQKNLSEEESRKHYEEFLEYEKLFKKLERPWTITH